MTPYYQKTFQRHHTDLERFKDSKKMRFNKKKGLAYIYIIQNLTHYKGETGLLKLEDWQKKVVAILFGWERKNKSGEWVRRFSTAFVFLPRKNGKTLLASGMLIADTIIRADRGGETVFFATKRDQAKLAYGAAVQMLKNNKELKEMTTERQAKTTFVRKGNSTEFYTLGRDSDTQDGLNVTRAVADEHHAHKDDSLWDVVKSSQTSRKEPFMMSITTAGFNIQSPAYNLYEYSKQVLEGIVEDDSLFAFIAEPPPKPQNDPSFYFREETWRMANPNYGISVDTETFALAAKEAKERPEKLNNFLVKYLNVWTTSAESYFPLHLWQKCQGDVKREGRAVVGMDLSITDDFSSVAWVYRVEEKYHIDIKFYIPKERAYERERELKVPLVSWINEGYITATEGVSIDYGFILHDLEQELENTEAFCYDPYQARTIVNGLEEKGFSSVFPIRQGYLTLSEPTATLLRHIREKNIIHENNPVLNWMISNTAILTDPAGNIKPNKSDRNRKIDGVAAIINTLAYLIHTDKPKMNVYEERGLRML